MLEALLVVALNVSSVLNALMTKHVRIKNALIHVQTCVDKTPNAESITIALFVTVWMVTLVIHFQDVIPSHVRLFLSIEDCYSIHVNFLSPSHST